MGQNDEDSKPTGAKPVNAEGNSMEHPFTAQKDVDLFNPQPVSQENSRANLETPELLDDRVRDSDPARRNEADNIHNPDSVNSGANVRRRQEEEKEDKEKGHKRGHRKDSTPTHSADGAGDSVTGPGGDMSGSTGTF